MRHTRQNPGPGRRHATCLPTSLHSTGACYIPGILESRDGQLSSYPYYKICGGNQLGTTLISRPLTDASGAVFGDYHIFRDYNDNLWITTNLAGTAGLQAFHEYGITTPSQWSITVDLNLPTPNSAAK